MFSLLLRNLNLKTLAYGQVALLIVIILYTWNQHERMKTERAEFQTARSSFEHPKTIEVVKVVYREGPVRIKTVVVEKHSGDRETTIIEEREGTTKIEETEAKSEPVLLSAMITKKNENRWLAGADLRNIDVKNYEAWTIYGGYSFSNRLDLLAGLGRHDKLESHLMAVIRF